MHTSPVESMGASTEFGSTAPASTKFTCDASSGIGEPHGHTVKNPQPVGSTAVTFNATADTPVDGTPPLPATGTRSVCPAGNRPTRRALAAARVDDAERSAATKPRREPTVDVDEHVRGGVRPHTDLARRVDEREHRVRFDGAR